MSRASAPALAPRPARAPADPYYKPEKDEPRTAPGPSPQGDDGGYSSSATAASTAAAVEAAVKHAILEVPDFGTDPDVGSMSTYLRLGAVPGAEDGDDLAHEVTSFLDDSRSRDGSPNSLGAGKRVAMSARLHTKGGWRDHTDGNRVTTTRGDKVEVIGGNYKMVVLGRGEGDAGWDVSGGHIEGLGGKSGISWDQEWPGGNWKTHEWAEKGHSEVIQHGNNLSEFYGDWTCSQTGSENEKRPIEDDGSCLSEGSGHTPERVLKTKSGPGLELASEPVARPKLASRVPKPKSTQSQRNPDITERTWASSITSYTGSEKLPVPTIENTTWAVRLTSVTNVGTMTDTTHVIAGLPVKGKFNSGPAGDGCSTSTTTIDGSSTSTTTIDGSSTSTTTIGKSTTDTTTVQGDMTSTTTVHGGMKSTTAVDGDMHSNTSYRNSVDISQGASMTSVNMVAAMTNVNLAVNNLQLNLALLTENINVGGMIDVTLAAALHVTMGGSIDINLADRIDIHPARQEVAESMVHLGADFTVISTFSSFL